MEQYFDIVTIDNAEEARLLKIILRERCIPHKILTSHDSGESMASQGWGLVKAPEEYRKMILYILADLRNNAARHP